MSRRLLFTFCLCAAWPVVCALSAPALAQTSVQAQQATLQPVVVEGVPDRPYDSSTSPDGDLFVLPRPGQGPDALTRLVPAGARYQRVPLSVGVSERINLDHFVESEGGEAWAVGGDVVATRDANTPWGSIPLEKLDPKACRERTLYGGPCQRVIPLGLGRAVVLRPVFEQAPQGKRVLSTRLVALVRGQDKPVATETLPNVILGPVVRDGQGGFWVMMRRVNTAVAGYKPLRGYLHYTNKGEWKVWSDSGESVPGLKFEGRTTFLIDPQARKMTPDARGGFLSIAKDGKIYRVGADGAVTRFLKNPRACSSCTNLSLSADPVAKRVMVLQAQARRGEVGQNKQANPLKWFLFDLDGAQIDSGEVKLPPDVKPGRDLYNTVRLHTQASNTWVVAPDLVLHWIGDNWRWLASSARIQSQAAALLGKQEPEFDATDVAITQGVFWGGMSVGIGGVILSSALIEDQGNWYGLLSLSLLAAYGGSYLVAPFLKEDAAGPYQTGCLLGTGAGMAALTGLNTWLWGGYLAPEDEGFGGAQLLGSVAGASVGTALGLMSAKLVLEHGGSDTMAQMLMTLLAGSASVVGYTLGQ